MLRLLILFLPLFLFAHKVNLLLDFEEDNLYINSYFANAKPCINCKFKIEADNILVFEGNLDNKGEYKYKTDLKDIKVTIDAGAGHIVSKNITRDKNIEHSIKNSSNTTEFNKLQEENLALKHEIKLLKEQLDYFEIFKIFFGLLLIAIIFFFIKRIKK